MKLLILCPGSLAASVNDIKCFTDVLSFYLTASLAKTPGIDLHTKTIPSIDCDQLKNLFLTLPVDEYDAILTLGLRFYSNISTETFQLLRNRYRGLICQFYDGTRLDYDSVDITFTIKNEDARLELNKKRYDRHKKYNEYVGWATDFSVNTPEQNPTDLRILVDHANYGDNPVDLTKEVLAEIKKLVNSGLWKEKYKSISVRRFDSGRVVDVDFDAKIEKYNRASLIPFTEITKEHCKAHIFCVTHPESVGLVVLETAAAGALAVVPRGFIAEDRLSTVRHIEWSNSIDWPQVLANINVNKSREMALKNSWEAVALRIYHALERRIKENGDRNGS